MLKIPEQMLSGGSLRQLSSKKTVEFESKLLPDDESFQFSTPHTSPFCCGLTCSWERKALPSNFLFFLSYALLDHSREQLKLPSDNWTHIWTANFSLWREKLHFPLFYHPISLKRIIFLHESLENFSVAEPRKCLEPFFFFLAEGEGGWATARRGV